MALTKYNAESYSTSGNYVINMALNDWSVLWIWAPAIFGHA